VSDQATCCGNCPKVDRYDLDAVIGLRKAWVSFLLSIAFLILAVAAASVVITLAIVK
jgi:hypothetical protein